MYGLVNKSVEGLICSKFGDDVWEKVMAKAGVDEIFIGTESYPDEITYKLVIAASEVLEMPVPKVLEAFGEYWITETAVRGYGGLLDLSGDSIEEFLTNLPNFHSRVTLMFPKLQPPRFEILEKREKFIRLKYITHREALAPFVVGILKGLGQRFGVALQIEHSQARAEAGHDEFVLTW